jgi:hypothetical protein
MYLLYAFQSFYRKKNQFLENVSVVFATFFSIKILDFFLVSFEILSNYFEIHQKFEINQKKQKNFTKKLDG